MTGVVGLVVPAQGHPEPTFWQRSIGERLMRELARRHPDVYEALEAQFRVRTDAAPLFIELVESLVVWLDRCRVSSEEAAR